ncbi:MAG: TraR/DksA family transcriptional regulator [Candidatus Omnitrophica bacterium]|nr:TraR/DksA family transcriptional regulator [Candidatus Omnitrophota bacterium]
MFKRGTAKFKSLLVKKREETVSEISHIARENLKSQKEVQGELSDIADMASDSYDRELNLNIASEEQKIIYEIDEALKRIEEGKYGKCLSCGKKIPTLRLKAVPYAKHCIQCQENIEKDKQ